MPAKIANTNYFDAIEHSPAPENSAEIGEDQQRLCEIANRVGQLRSEILERIARRGQDQAGVLQQSLERDV
ncbi:MAG: hypothetical protein RSA54_13765, partial [Glutamicibacter sp.]